MYVVYLDSALNSQIAKRVKQAIAALRRNDIDFAGLSIRVSRDETTWVKGSNGIKAQQLMRVVDKAIENHPVISNAEHAEIERQDQQRAERQLRAALQREKQELDDAKVARERREKHEQALAWQEYWQNHGMVEAANRAGRNAALYAE